MKGSEKQIKWAEEIKESAFRALDCMVSNYNRRIEWGEDPVRGCGYDLDAVEEVRTQVTEAFNKVEEASTVIDKRYKCTHSYLEQIARAITKNRH